ncbi:hypothetical protein RB195_021633 [Necator americanus]|uniref:SCP domain-containing protein n=1 Tax=Necator americanus TaxID=51031 RepID=A0ABR1EC93_NECAM
MSVSTLSLCVILVLFPLATLQRWEDNAPMCSTDLNLRLQPKQRDGLFKAVSGKYAYMKYNCTLEEAAYLLWNSRYNATPEKFNTIFGLYPFYYNWTETNKTSAEFFKEAADKWRNDTLNDWYGHRQMGCDFEKKSSGDLHNYTVFCFISGTPIEYSY